MSLVSIGEFAGLSRLSPKALRLYDEHLSRDSHARRPRYPCLTREDRLPPSMPVCLAVPVYRL